MLVETADAAAVAMRITRAEWAALREADIRAAVDHALETRGLAPWTSMKIELFVAEKEVLLIARPISTPPRRFRFHSFADLTAALGCFPAGLDSDVVYIDGGWELFVRTGDEPLPNALFEFGEPLPCTEELYAHIGEHGDVVARRDAVGTLQRYFC